MNRLMLRLAPLALLPLLVACGGTANEPSVREGLATAKTIFEDARTNTTWQGELDVAVGNNAPIAPFVIAHLPAGAKFKNYQDKSCRDSWCVAIKIAGPGEFTLEAYGESTARPIATETIKAY